MFQTQQRPQQIQKDFYKTIFTGFMTVQERAENRKLYNNKLYIVECEKENSSLANMNERVLNRAKCIKNAELSGL